MPGGWHLLDWPGQSWEEVRIVLISHFSVGVFDLIQGRHRSFHQDRFISIHVGWPWGLQRAVLFPSCGHIFVHLIEGPLQE